MLEPSLINTYLVFPILNVLMLFYRIATLLRIPGAFGFSIIALTVLIRLLFQPFFHRQIETAKKMQELKPHLDALQKKHKKDPKTLQAQQMKLYQEAGINPASGCLVMIVQLPVFIGLYRTLSLSLTNGAGKMAVQQINSVLYSALIHVNTIDPWFFGYNLTLSPSQAGSIPYYAVPLITGILQYFQAQATMMGQTKTKPTNNETKKNDTKGKKKETDNGADFQQALNTQMRYMFPVMIAWFSFSLPVGLSLYWNIFSLFSIFQYRKIHGTSNAIKKDAV